MALVLGMKIGERISIGDDVVIELVGFRGKQAVRIALTAPKSVCIMREKLAKYGGGEPFDKVDPIVGAPW